tara:strand:- start:305 stop:604 length:300 start_codon:yes stop_codon:yes gene_type:complete
MNDPAKKIENPPVINLEKEDSLRAQVLGLQRDILRRELEDCQRALVEHDGKMLEHAAEMGKKYDVDFRLYMLKGDQAVLNQKAVAMKLRSEGGRGSKED